MTSPSSQEDPLEEFGPNKWLVDEMYERYLEDPNSVDPAWLDYFQKLQASNGTVTSSLDTSTPTTQATQAAQTTQATPTASTSGTDTVAGTRSARAGSTSTASSSAAPTPASSSPTPQQTTQQQSTQQQPTQQQPTQQQAGQQTQLQAAQQTQQSQSAPQAERPKATPADPEVSVVAGRATTRTQQPTPSAPANDPEQVPLRGAAARTARNMDDSLLVPTATSVRQVPVKLLIDNRIILNNFLKRSRGGKVSFTHMIGYAIAKAIRSMPEMNYGYTETDGKPALIKPPHLGLGLAIDVPKSDGTRQLLVPSIKTAETLSFTAFWTAYEDLVERAREGKLGIEDFQGTTMTLTNPGTIGTSHSVPRLMNGQGCIVGVGAMEYPPEYQGASQETMNRLGVSKIMTLTSTYDHRVIQGAQSGEFLRRVHQLLLGEDGFYDDIFHALRIPYEPVRWVADISASHDDEVGKQARVLELIHAYRVRGHLMADTDPLEYKVRTHPDLDIVTHGLTLWDLEREFATGSFGGEVPFLKLRKILGILRDAYCRTTGIEYMHIQDPDERRWIQEQVEQAQDNLPRDEQLRTLSKLNEAEAFETFLQTKYVGQKRFSLEGGESTIAMLDEITDQAAINGLDEVCIGMAHRGRLNVLANIVGKGYAQIFREFEGNLDPRTVQGSGDVKYHLGAEGEFVGQDGHQIKVSVAANPSHLEAVNPVLEGIARAKQDILNRGPEYPVLPILVHGDAAFAGQGVVAETLNLSQLRGYRTGGTVHVIVNNQVGFTTAPASSRSSLYCTDVARMIQAPIFHVNGDDPEACIRVARMAFEFRQAFNKDVVIDLICYRRRGHNEGDDPSFTQPLMYDLIEQKRSVRKLYTEALIGRGDISLDEAEQALKDYEQKLERVFYEARKATETPSEPYATVPEYPDKPAAEMETKVPFEVLKKISDAYLSVPEGYTVHRKVLPQLQRRAASITEGPIDWATAEIVAYGSLLVQGRPVRLAGQDSRRGTFVQRFATVVDRNTGNEWTPLSHLDENQAPFYIYDSLLSEFAAMGFDYGYSVARPDALVCWEAQFGDFANGAQTIIDEFISAGEAKWNQNSGIVLLLPHGYEGQGPDHSSARIERFLQLTAGESMTVAQPSTPANYFHLLRRHCLGSKHRPLIIFTPKQMLRVKAATSQPADFTSGAFQPVIGDDAVDPTAVTKVLLTSGRITWDLMSERDKREASHTAVVRLEQLNPLPIEQLQAELAGFPNLREVCWVQDEPSNQGAWPHLMMNLAGRIGDLQPISRAASAAPAVGTKSVHDAELETLLDQAFA